MRLRSSLLRAGGSKADWLVRAVLVLLALRFFRQALAGGVFYERDIHQIWMPQVEGFVHAVAGGAPPLWDPSPAFGQPLLADPRAQVLYPPTWLNRAVAVRAGRHRIEIVYRPPLVIAGAGLSVLAFLGLLGGLHVRLSKS